jgi:H/ACA ribonucleoprotein complex non-core subunit NAF1
MNETTQEHIVDTQNPATDKNDVTSEAQVENVQNQEIVDGEKHENVNDENNESEIFNLDQVVKYSSDEESGEDDSTSSNTDSNSGSNSDSDSDSSSDSDSNTDDEDEEDLQSKIRNAEDDDDEINENDSDEPIISKNEMLDFKVPSLPENYLITEETNIQYIGNISGIVEKNVMIKGSQSAEEKVLKEGTIFCFEDRTPLGLMYEVFGRLQTPVYTVKFNSQEDADKFKGRKGDKIFYVVPSAEFLLTQQIKNIKGTDASNCNDEEIPEDEQEFSDDEKEAVAKKNKKRKKKQTNIGPIETADTTDGMEATNLVTSVNNNNSQGQFKRAKQDHFKVRQSGEVPISVKARLTSLPSKTKPATSASDITLSQKQQQQQQPQQHQHQHQHQQQPQQAIDPMVMMQNFMSMMQKASGLSQQQNSNFYQNPSSDQHQYGQQQQYNQYSQYTQQNQQNQSYNGQFNGQFNHQYSGYNQQYNHQSYGQQNFAYNHQFNQQSYQQHLLPSPASAQLPVNSGNSNGNTALLVAQLAAAISKNALNSATNLEQSNFNSAQNDSTVGNQNNKYEENDEYDPTA